MQKNFADFGIQLGSKTLISRFEKHVARAANGCHVWTGAKTDKGYGLITVRGKVRRAHRVAYEVFKGGIPEGLSRWHASGEHARDGRERPSTHRHH
ncbi:hypothetical protein [Burkholderia ubonensis]|uniref:hypothetical protein n=1 Tax=Burkholderia ubonensis TaxID=101571 RepID=UPI0012F75777|nr:hypothetical protein [Burkholderia ubonensis]